MAAITLLCGCKAKERGGGLYRLKALNKAACLMFVPD